MSRCSFAALTIALLLAPYPTGAAPAPRPRPTQADRNETAREAIRAALRDHRSTSVTLEAALNEELTLPTPPVGKAYTLEMADGEGVYSTIIYAADAGRAFGVTHRATGTMRATMKIEGTQQHRPFNIV